MQLCEVLAGCKSGQIISLEDHSARDMHPVHVKIPVHTEYTLSYLVGSENELEKMHELYEFLFFAGPEGIF